MYRVEDAPSRSQTEGAVRGWLLTSVTRYKSSGSTRTGLRRGRGVPRAGEAVGVGELIPTYLAGTLRMNFTRFALGVAPGELSVISFYVWAVDSASSYWATFD